MRSLLFIVLLLIAGCVPSGSNHTIKFNTNASRVTLTPLICTDGGCRMGESYQADAVQEKNVTHQANMNTGKYFIDFGGSQKMGRLGPIYIDRDRTISLRFYCE